MEIRQPTLVLRPNGTPVAAGPRAPEMLIGLALVGAMIAVEALPGLADRVLVALATGSVVGVVLECIRRRVSARS